ncbi:MAG: hypothetical protein A3F18_08580 [Legionellales bacterium RIFCSPHIGHO2_12_FULL_37_14]|nr:MAG: hypothetical protein A3F18_08580 [Legionellales bacterium RIFCSPHIGHO2_12_FULL_37_14]
MPNFEYDYHFTEPKHKVKIWLKYRQHLASLSYKLQMPFGEIIIRNKDLILRDGQAFTKEFALELIQELIYHPVSLYLHEPIFQLPRNNSCNQFAFFTHHVSREVSDQRYNYLAKRFSSYLATNANYNPKTFKLFIRRLDLLLIELLEDTPSVGIWRIICALCTNQVINGDEIKNSAKIFLKSFFGHKILALRAELEKSVEAFYSALHNTIFVDDKALKILQPTLRRWRDILLIFKLPLDANAEDRLHKFNQILIIHLANYLLNCHEKPSITLDELQTNYTSFQQVILDGDPPQSILLHEFMDGYIGTLALPRECKELLASNMVERTGLYRKIWRILHSNPGEIGYIFLRAIQAHLRNRKYTQTSSEFESYIGVREILHNLLLNILYVHPNGNNKIIELCPTNYTANQVIVVMDALSALLKQSRQPNLSFYREEHEQVINTVLAEIATYLVSFLRDDAVDETCLLYRNKPLVDYVVNKQTELLENYLASTSRATRTEM